MTVHPHSLSLLFLFLFLFPAPGMLPLTSRAQLGPARQGFRHQARPGLRLSPPSPPIPGPQRRHLGGFCPHPHLPPAAESGPPAPPVWILPRHWTARKTLHQHLLWAGAMLAGLFFAVASICPVLLRVLRSILSSLESPPDTSSPSYPVMTSLTSCPSPFPPPLKVTRTSVVSRPPALS